MRKLMQSPFENDPFCLLLEAFKELYPEKAGNFQAIWNPDINDGFGRTGFEVGRPPLIELNANEPVVIQTETFAHELAHVAVGIEAGHGKEWQKAFDRIHERYEKLCEELFCEGDGGEKSESH